MFHGIKISVISIETNKNYMLTPENENENENQTLNKPKLPPITKPFQLGDVVSISASDDITLNGIFYIKYLSPKTIKLYNDEVKTIERKIINGFITSDRNEVLDITRIELLYRNPEKGYAKQNNLILNTWLRIDFGVNPGTNSLVVPITCKITQVIEDMIVVSRYPENDTYYINFNYYGLPDELNITSIEIQAPPVLTQEDAEAEPFEEDEAVNMNLTETEILEREIEYGAKQNPSGRTYFFFADDADSTKRRYPIEVQADDLFNNILTHLKSRKKTNSIDDDVEFTNVAHIMVERFIQLRKEFSVFNEDNTVMSVLTKAVTDKPLKDYFDNFNTSLHWIMPVITNIKKVYNDLLYEINIEDPQYENLLDISEDRAFLTKLNDAIMTNQMNYEEFLKEVSDIFTPFVLRKNRTKKVVSTNINTIVNSLEEYVDFMSLGGHVGSENSLAIRDNVRFSLLKYNIGLSYLDTINKSKKKPDTFFERKRLHLQADEMQIMSFLVLPESVIRFSRVNLPASSLLMKSNLSLNYLRYFQLLNDTTTVENNTTSNEIQPKKNEIINYGLMDGGDYEESVNKMAPSTKNVFESMKQYINGKLSVVEVVGHLEPFLVYTRDIHYKLFQEIVKFIEKRIASYKGQLTTRGAVFGELVTEKDDLIKLCTTNLSLMTILNLFSGENVKINVLNEYNIIDDKDEINNTLYTNSDIYRKMILTDYAKLFCSAISLENSILMVPENIDDDGEPDLAARIVDALQEKVKEEFNYQLKVIEVIKSIESYNFLKYNIKKYDMRVVDIEIIEPIEVIKIRDLILQKEDGIMKYFQIRQLVNNFGRKAFAHENNKSWYYCNLGDDNIDSVLLLPLFVFEMADAFVRRRSPEEYNEFLKNLIKRLKAKKSANNVYYQDPKTGWPIVRIDFVGEQEIRFTDDDVEENEENEETNRLKQDTIRLDDLQEEEKEDFEEETELLDVGMDEERIMVINQIINGLTEKLSIAKLPLNIRHFILNNVNKYVKSMLPEAEHNAIQSKKDESKRVSFTTYIERGILFSTVAVFFIAFQTSLQDLRYGRVRGCVRSFEGYPLVNDENDNSGLTYMACVLKSMKRSKGIWKHVNKEIKDNQSNLVSVIKKSLLREQTIIQKIDRKKLQIANGDARKKETREENLLDKWQHFLPPLEEQLLNLNPISKEDITLLQTSLTRTGAGEAIQKMDSMIFRLSLIIQKQIQDIVSSDNDLLMKNYVGENYISNNCCQAVLTPGSRVFDYFNDESGKVIEFNNRIAFQLSRTIIGTVQFSKASLMCSMFDTRNQFPTITEKFNEKTIIIALIYYLKYKTGEKIEIPELKELCLQQERDFTKLSIPEIIVELKKDEVSFKNCFNQENFDRVLKIVSKKKIVPSFTSNNCLQITESIFIEEKEENGDVLEEEELKLLEMLKNPMNQEAKDAILSKNNANVTVIQKFLKSSQSIRFFKKGNLELRNPLESTTTAFSSFYVKVNFFKNMISNMVYLYPEKIIRYSKDNKINLPPGIVKITDSHKLALKNMMLEERNDPVIEAKNEDVKRILQKVKESAKCRFLEKLSRNCPVFNSPVFNEEEKEATEIFYDYIAYEILVSYIRFFEEMEKNTSSLLEQRTGKVTREQIQTLLQRYINMFSDFGKKKKTQLGIELSYQEISDIYFNDTQREKNKILEKLTKMSDDEREAYNDTKRLKGKQTILNYKEVSQAKAKAKNGDVEEEDTGEYEDVEENNDEEAIFSGEEDEDLGNDGNQED